MSISASLMPHAVCWASAPKLIWTMVITNSITFLSYLVICFTLLYLARRTQSVLARDWAYFVVGFALFIAACGSTHIFEVITTWIPVFWSDAIANVLTAALSGYVAIMLILRAKRIGFSINDYANRLSETESEKLRLQDSLVAAQKIEEWSRMSATVSHEIRGPLDAIQNQLYLIRTSGHVSPEIAELAQLADEEAKRVLTISESTLSFIRHTKEKELIDICKALESVRFVLDPLIQEKAINLEVEVHGNCIVQAYGGETRQVLLNIIRNACEAVVSPGARVGVTLTGGQDGVEVVVADDGIGIEPEALKRLFEFGVTTKGEKGNGIGLWTVKHILHKHGGTIKVDSVRNAGTNFRLWWPRAVQSDNEAVT